jgi:DNA polymerase-3 subunit gamma/tau
MGRALYRKYRSKTLAEIVGQEHITKALSNALEANRISHAYLFTGPRGIGKTSIARILAFEVNGLPYDESSTHLDIIEIDAASNRRIDEIRDLREKVHIAPTSAKYKVYIIDEVHMLTREAFNALLKTLEEPPEHVIFILATTEVHKLPETIISRTQHFTFKPIEPKKVAEHLKSIAKAEKIKIDDEALELIAKHGGGSFRDSISMLDQVQHSGNKITASDIRTMLGLAPDEIVLTVSGHLTSGNAKELVLELESLHAQGIEPALFARQLGAAIRQNIIDTQPENALEQGALLEKLIEIPASVDPYLSLEATLLEAAFTRRKSVQANTGAKTPPPTPVKKEAPQPEPKPKTAPKPKAESEAEIKAETKAVPDPEDTSSKPKSTKSLDSSLWQDVLTHVKQDNNTLYGVLRMAQPSFTPGTITLVLKFAFHQKRLNEPKNRQVIASAVERASGESMKIVCVIQEGDAASNEQPTASETENSNSIGTISNIFGGAELLES